MHIKDWPIQFRHFRIQPAEVPSMDDPKTIVSGYEALDYRDVRVSYGQTLGALILAVLNLDTQAEIAQQFVDRHLPNMTHLDGVDIDAEKRGGPGVLVPSYYEGGGGPGPGGGRPH